MCALVDRVPQAIITVGYASQPTYDGMMVWKVYLTLRDSFDGMYYY